MQERFEKLFYEFEPEEVKSGKCWGSPQAYFHGERSIPDAKLNLGYQIVKVPALVDNEPHYHREEEYLAFLGTSLPDMFPSFDAEIHLYMGKTLETMEKIVITEPSIVRIPRGWRHGPLRFVRVDKPVFFQAIMHAGSTAYLKEIESEGGERLTIVLGEDTDLSKGVSGTCKCVGWTAVNEDGIELYTDAGAYCFEKAPKAVDCVRHPGFKTKPYSDATVLKAPKPALSDEAAKCVLVCPKETTQWGEWCPCPQFYFRGQTYMEDAGYHVGYQIFTGANDMEDPHMHMGAEEYIFFVGANPQDIFDFDCQIEMFIGDDPDHMESRIITKPTVVRIPPNVWHCPILFRKMKKPVMFQAALMSGTWGTINREEGRAQSETGEPDPRPFSRKIQYSYLGDDVRLCKFNEAKRCIICGACQPKPEDYLPESER